jgi:hypothetical protein
VKIPAYTFDNIASAELLLAEINPASGYMSSTPPIYRHDTIIVGTPIAKNYLM